MTDPSSVARCPECGTNILDTNFVEYESGVATYRCPNCSYLQYAEVLIGAEAAASPAPRSSVSISWKFHSASTAELAALRQLMPRYAAMSVAQLFHDVKGSELHLGVFDDGEARELQERGQTLGLNVVLSSADE